MGSGSRCPSRTILKRPGRSVMRKLPSGRNASPHGRSSPSATMTSRNVSLSEEYTLPSRTRPVPATRSEARTSPTAGSANLSTREEVLLESLQRSHVLLGPREPESHGVDAQMADPAHRAPRLHLLRPFIPRDIGQRYPPFDAEGGWVAARVAHVAEETIHGVLCLRAGAEGLQRDPAVGQPRGAAEDGVVRAAHPDWNGPLNG